MIHEHPLGYLIGLEGLALLRGFVGDHGREFTEERLAEVRRLLADPSLVGVDVERVGTVAGYRAWSSTYDDPGNAAFAIDEPVVRGFLDGVAPGVALDAACGTGRYAAWLAESGHRVVGVDSSPEMLAHARNRVPAASFVAGDLRHLPVDPSSVDLVTCGLALTHLPDLGPVFAEFARVLRPGGHLVVADIHPDAVSRGSIPPLRTPEGKPARLVSHHHAIGVYLRAALAVGLDVRGCEEPTLPAADHPATGAPGPWDTWPWSLATMIPGAVVAAPAPALVVWHFTAR